MRGDPEFVTRMAERVARPEPRDVPSRPRPQPARTWTTVGEQLLDYERAASEGHRATGRDLIEQAIGRLRWLPTNTGQTMPAMAGLAVDTLIAELRLPNVSHVAVTAVECIPVPTDNEVPTYELIGLRCRYTNGTAEIFVVDRGSDLLVVASDFTPA